MWLNIHILFDELQGFSPVLVSSASTELDLKQPRMLVLDNNTPSPGYLYIALDDEIDIANLGSKGFSELSLLVVGMPSEGALDELQSLCASLLYLPTAEDKWQVFSQLQDIYERYGDWEHDLYQALVSEHPLQEVLNIGAQALRNPLGLHDTSLLLLHQAGELPEDCSGTIWEHIRRFGHMPMDGIPKQENSEVFHLMETTRGPFYYQYSQLFQPHRLLICALYCGERRLGYLILTDINAPFSSGQLSLVGFLALVIEKALTMEPSFAFGTSSASESILLDRLFRGFTVDEHALHYYLRERRWNLDGTYCVYRFANAGDEPIEEGQFSPYTHWLQGFFGIDALTFIFGGAVVCVTHCTNSSGQRGADANSQGSVNLDELDKLIAKMSLKCGISEHFPCFENIGVFHDQSHVALVLGSADDEDSLHYFFSDYCTRYIIESLEEAVNLRMICLPQVLRLGEMDNGSCYLDCLRAFLLSGCNLTQAAARLYLHRNTLRYRLDKVARLLDLDLSTLGEDLVFRLLFSCEACRHLEVSDNQILPRTARSTIQQHGVRSFDFDKNVEKSVYSSPLLPYQ